MNEPDLFEYADETRTPTPGDLVVGLPSSLGTKAELLEALRLALALPDYFGRNWDALDEVLRDLNWIRERDVILVHADLPLQRGDEKHLETYWRVLSRLAEAARGPQASCFVSLCHPRSNHGGDDG
jgi:RNAse (barnase) inhibitor barstar